MQRKVPIWLIGTLLGGAYFTVTFLIEFIFRCKLVWEFTGHCGEIYSPFGWLNFPASIGMLFIPHLLKFGTFTQVMIYYLIVDLVLGMLITGLIFKIHRRKQHKP